jgi:hypothetical protein
MTDRIHPNVRGHSLAAQLLIHFLRTELTLMHAMKTHMPIQAVQGGDHGRADEPSGAAVGVEQMSATNGVHTPADLAQSMTQSPMRPAKPTGGLSPPDLPPPLHAGNTHDDEYDAVVCVRGKVEPPVPLSSAAHARVIATPAL